jgi:hypothetical protein
VLLHRLLFFSFYFSFFFLFLILLNITCYSKSSFIVLDDLIQRSIPQIREYVIHIYLIMRKIDIEKSPGCCLAGLSDCRFVGLLEIITRDLAYNTRLTIP